ncbi:MAG: hypothetical protein ACREKN_07075 [Longimicrobiaceae bacterium]
MSWKKSFQKSAEELARDELFAHIHRCGVLGASEEQQRAWMDETIDFLAGRYPSLSEPQFDELSAVGLRFCRPALKHGADNHALAGENESVEEVAAV